MPPVTLAWYQRDGGVAARRSRPQFVFVALTPRCTVWSTQSDSAPPMFEYWVCAIARIGRASAALAGVGAFAGVAFGQQVGLRAAVAAR